MTWLRKQIAGLLRKLANVVHPEVAGGPGEERPK